MGKEVKWAFNAFSIFIFWTFSSLVVLSEEMILQKEKLKFEKCIDVIYKTSEMLAINPTILNKDNSERSAIFKLSDGKMKILCDGEKGLIVVSTY